MKSHYINNVNARHPLYNFYNPQLLQYIPVSSICQLINILPHRYKFTCNAHTFFCIVPFFGCPPSQHIKCQRYSEYPFKPPNTRTIPTLRVSPLCYSGCFVVILFSGCSFIPANQVPIQATQHKDDTLYPS